MWEGREVPLGTTTNKIHNGLPQQWKRRQWQLAGPGISALGASLVGILFAGLVYQRPLEGPVHRNRCMIVQACTCIYYINKYILHIFVQTCTCVYVYIYIYMCKCGSRVGIPFFLRKEEAKAVFRMESNGHLSARSLRSDVMQLSANLPRDWI